MIVDGNSLTYRAFFALPIEMETTSGQVTNAIHGFSSMLINLIRDQKPKNIVVAFDRHGKTFRHEKVPTYKGNREKQPDVLYEQLALVKELVELLGFVSVDAEGFEADDIIATLATAAKDQGLNSIVVTGDRDSFQLVEDPYIRVLYNKRGVSDYVLYDETGILERTGVKPKQYVEYAALRGDQSDNLPGVPGVGEKTASKLINSYDDLTGIFEASSEQTPKLRENLENNTELAFLNVEMMTLVRDVPLDIDIKNLKQEKIDSEQLNFFLEKLELNSIRRGFKEVLDFEYSDSSEVGVLKDSSLEVEYETCDSPETVNDILSSLKGSKRVSLAVSLSPDGSGVALAVCADGDCYWFPREILSNKKAQIAFSEFFSFSPIGVAVSDGKKLYKTLLKNSIKLENICLDLSIAAYLLDPAESSYEVGRMLEEHTSFSFPSIGTPEGQLNLEIVETDYALESVVEAAAIGKLFEPIKEALKKRNLEDLNNKIELPLVKVLAEMELRGVAVDLPELTRLRDQLTKECESLRSIIHNDAGEEFNVNSTKQLREILFEKLELKPGKKTKTGYSTNAATLEKLRGFHPIIENLLSYREVEKLRSTYGEGLLASVDDDNRIRATFNQTVTRTGRLSSDAPNLHNIPIRTETGKAFRKAFVPKTGFALLVADYNQIELRCIAHLADERELKTAFNAGEDIHTTVAARTWKTEASNVDSALRNRAKMVIYGLAYGMEAYGLAQRLDISVDEASEILKSFFSAFPGVSSYMKDSVEMARSKGYSETLLGRRRKIPELLSNNFNVRQAGERQAMNAPIQGLAADIFKLALISIDQKLLELSYDSALVLQVHDEVILEVSPKEINEVTELVKNCMESAYELSVELRVEMAVGKSWAEAKN